MQVAQARAVGHRACVDLSGEDLVPYRWSIDDDDLSVPVVRVGSVMTKEGLQAGVSRKQPCPREDVCDMQVCHVKLRAWEGVPW